jgi:hypothetical protein
MLVSAKSPTSTATHYNSPKLNLRELTMSQTTLSRTQLTLPETQKVAERIATLKLTGSPSPLKLGKSLEAFKKTDLTPIIGTEFEQGIQLSELLKAPNADELIRDLAILGTLIRLQMHDRASRLTCVLVLVFVCFHSVPEGRCVFP